MYQRMRAEWTSWDGTSHNPPKDSSINKENIEITEQRPSMVSKKWSFYFRRGGAVYLLIDM